jgi:hypothetical protein
MSDEQSNGRPLLRLATEAEQRANDGAAAAVAKLTLLLEQARRRVAGFLDGARGAAVRVPGGGASSRHRASRKAAGDAMRHETEQYG